MNENILIGVLQTRQFEPLIDSPITGFVNGLILGDPCEELQLTYRAPDPYATHEQIMLALQNGDTPCLQIGESVLTIMASELTSDQQAGAALGLVASLQL